MKGFSTPSSRLRSAKTPLASRRAATTNPLRFTSMISPLMNNGRTFPAGHFPPITSEISTKGEERGFDDAALITASKTIYIGSSDETRIDVFVRCRGRNEREARENNGIAVNIDESKGKTVELSMGPNAPDKLYSFDKVFSPKADQQMIFDEAVGPILDEVGEQRRDHVGRLTSA